MYIIREDAMIVNSEETRRLKAIYKEKFGVRFPGFNYESFHSEPQPGGLVAGDVYCEAIRKCIESGVPYSHEQ